MLDFGYPQNCALEVLRAYINLGSVRAPDVGKEAEEMTSYITGARDWRREGIFHKKNAVWIDVLERVNLTMSSRGTVLRNDVTGQIKMKTKLTGIPDCKVRALSRPTATASGPPSHQTTHRRTVWPERQNPHGPQRPRRLQKTRRGN